MVQLLSGHKLNTRHDIIPCLNFPFSSTYTTLNYKLLELTAYAVNKKTAATSLDECSCVRAPQNIHNGKLTE